VQPLPLLSGTQIKTSLYVIKKISGKWVPLCCTVGATVMDVFES